MIQINGLYKKYKEDYIYQDFNVAFEEYKTTSILGPSGCGKTTLLRILAGLETYQKGEIIGTKDKKIAYIFQEDRLIPWMNAEDNIKFVLKSYLNEEEARDKTLEMLELLKLLDYKDYMPEELSGGMKRRVAIGRALAYDSEILLMDEPFKGLDSDLKEEVLLGFKEMMRKKPRTVIYVTHDENEAEKIADYIYEWGKSGCGMPNRIIGK